jgi:7-cyano-7-deazaguanine synthase
METENIIISLSGGLDSSCLVPYLLSEGVEKIKAYSFKWGQKHSVELKKVKKNIQFLQSKGVDITHHIIDLTDAFNESKSSLHKGGEAIPEGHYAAENMKSTVVENRNVIFSSIIYGKALSWSKEVGEVSIALGIHSGDHTVYLDTTPESRAACEEAFKISNWGSENVDYIAPFEYYTKAQLLHESIDAMKSLGWTKSEIKKFLKNTHTCYNPDAEGRSCGKCGSCNERLEAFSKNKMKDPIKYVE